MIMEKLILLVLLCFISCGTVFGEKEKVQDESLDQITNQLWHEIEKRLQTYDTPEPKLGGCLNAKNATNKIIKTKESLDAGAVFLDSPDSTSPINCQHQCCASKDCNVAVFKNKDGETSCYMFDCGNPSLCEFVEHEGFIVFSIPNKKTSKSGVVHEDDLERLAAPTTTTTQSTTIPTTTTTTTTTTTPAPTTTTEKRHHVSLFGECTEDDQCSDSYAVCLAGYCVCNKGYSYQESVCRPDCTKFQFKCANERQPLAYPQCIAIYDKCDGIIHCKDGSDEVGCPTEPNVKDSINNNDASSIYQGSSNRKMPTMQTNGGIQSQNHQENINNDYHLQLKNLNANNNRQPSFYDIGQGMSYYDPDYRSHGPEKQQSSVETNPYVNNNNYGHANPISNDYQQKTIASNNVQQLHSPSSSQAAAKTGSQIISNRVQQNKNAIQNNIEDKPLQRQRPYPMKQSSKMQKPNINANQQVRPSNSATTSKIPIVEKTKPESIQQNSYNNQPHQIQRKPGVNHVHGNVDFNHKASQYGSGTKQNMRIGDKGSMSKQTSSSGKTPVKNSNNGYGQGSFNSKQSKYNSNIQNNNNDIGSKYMINQQQQQNKAQNPYSQQTKQQNVKPSNSDTVMSNQQYNPYKVWNSVSENINKAPLRPSPTYMLPIKTKTEPVYSDTYKPYSDSSSGSNMVDNSYKPSKHGGYLTEGGYVRGNGNRNRNVWKDLSSNSNDGSSSLFGGGSNIGSNGYNSWNRGNYWNGGNNNYQYYDTGSEWPSRGYYPKQPLHYDYYNVDTGYQGYNPYNIGNSLKSLWSLKQPVDSGYWNSDSNSETREDGDNSIENNPKTGNKDDPHTTVKAAKTTKPTKKPESHTEKVLTTKSTSKAPEQKPTLTPSAISDKSDENKDGQDEKPNVNDNTQSKEDHSKSDSSSSKDTDTVKSDSDSSKEDNTDNNEESNNLPVNTKYLDKTDQLEDTNMLEESNGNSYVGIVEEKLVIQSSKGAVVALSLGLVITFLLLVFVGCRLRNVRKKLRHGRPMSSNEADYLINGMYL